MAQVVQPRRWQVGSGDQIVEPAVMLAGCSGSPFSRVNTLPESAHAEPHDSRAVS